jgi:hypothetical protein
VQRNLKGQIMSRLHSSFLLPLMASYTLTGCALGQMGQLNSNIQTAQAQAQANAQIGLANAHTQKYVVADSAWLCSDEPHALAKAACEGGRQIQHNGAVTVIGQAAKAGVWPASVLDAQGEHRLYVAADAVADLPNVKALDAFADDVAQRYPEAKRIPLTTVNSMDLIVASQYRGRVIVVRQSLHDLLDQDFSSGRFGFALEIPAWKGSKISGRVQLELRNQQVSSDFESGNRSYVCGPEYCDEFVIVAELTDKTVQWVDKYGVTLTIPVFAIRELGDRFGTYRSDPEPASPERHAKHARR